MKLETRSSGQRHYNVTANVNPTGYRVIPGRGSRLGLTAGGALARWARWHAVSTQLNFLQAGQGGSDFGTLAHDLLIKSRS
jgi:hypothetical protein